MRFVQEKCEICTGEILMSEIRSGNGPNGPSYFRDNYVNHTQLLFAPQCTVIQPPCCNVNAGIPEGEASSKWIRVIKIVAQVVL